MTETRLILVAAWLALMAAPASALTLEDAIAAGLARSDPALEGMRMQAARQADATEAATLENPDAQVDVIRENGQANPSIQAELYQPLRLSQLTGERSSYAASLRALADSERKVRDLKTVSDVSTAYLKLWLLQARKVLFERSLEEIAALSGVVGRSAASGQTAPAARELFSGDREQLASAIKGILAEMGDARVELAHLTGLALSEERLAEPVFSPIPPADALVALASRRVTWRSVLRDRVDNAARRLEVAETDGALPAIGPRLLYSHDPTAVQDSVGIGVAVRIPLWNQNDAEKARARSDLNTAQLAHDRYQQLPLAETIRALRQTAVMRTERREELRDRVLPRYRHSYELTRSMYRQGQSDALALWQVREKLYQTEEVALAALSEAYLARLKLEAEVGGKLEEVP